MCKISLGQLLNVLRARNFNVESTLYHLESKANLFVLHNVSLVGSAVLFLLILSLSLDSRTCGAL